MNGILVVDKPSGVTSHDVVARCRRILGQRKIGHAGTLDPAATGILVLGVGRATRLLQFLEAQRKVYRATITLGVSTSTLDAEGEVVATADASAVTQKDLMRVLPAFRGTIQQVPPMVSAIKIGGEALYKKALRGEVVERAPRTVTIEELTLESFTPPTLRVVCSKGTYIRTLAADIGDALGVGAHVATLRRLASGPYDEAMATPLEKVTAEAIVPMEQAAAGFPRRDLTAAQTLEVVQGKRLQAAGIDGAYALFSAERLIGMAQDSDSIAKTLCVLIDHTEVPA